MGNDVKVPASRVAVRLDPLVSSFEGSMEIEVVVRVTHDGGKTAEASRKMSISYDVRPIGSFGDRAVLMTGEAAKALLAQATLDAANDQDQRRIPAAPDVESTK